MTDQIQAVIDAELFVPLIALLESSDFDVKKEAAQAVSNATSGGSAEQIRYLVRKNCIPPLCSLLDERNHNLFLVALDCLENVLKAGSADAAVTAQENAYTIIIDQHGGIERLKELAMSTEPEVSAKATKIIQDYIRMDGDPAASGTQAPQQMA